LPDNLNPEHQYYEQRGQTIQETVPRQIETTTVLQNVYIVIHGYNFYKFWTDDNGNVGYDVQYKIYNNKQQYLDDPMDWVDEGDILGGFYPITSSGEIALIADIEAEFDQTGGTDISLFQARDDAGLTAGEVSMTDFYGLSDVAAATVVTNAASSVTGTSMTLNGNVTGDGGGTISSRGFYFGTSSTYTNNTKYTVGSGTGTFSTNRTGLTGSTTYYITAFAINEAGETVGSTISQATSYQYQFKSTIHDVFQSAGTVSLVGYYSSVGFTWIQRFSVGPGISQCLQHEVSGRENRLDAIATTQSYSNEIDFYLGGCGGSGAISLGAGYYSAGTGNITVGGFVRIWNFTTKNFYYSAS
jgi:hypothetical protein